MPGEARLKLTIDSSQAERKVKILDEAINSLGSHKPITGIDGKGSDDSSSTSSTTDSSKLVDLQSRFNKRFETYAGETSRTYQSVLKKLDDLISAGGGTSGSGSAVPSTPNSNSPTSNSSSATPKKSSSQQSGGTLNQVLKKLATGATIATAVNGLLSYAKTGASSSKNSEMLAYQTYGTSGLYKGSYDTARNAAADAGSPYGYNVYDTLGVQSTLIGSTGATSESNVNKDTTATLKAARTFNVDENTLASVYGSLYKSGTYTNGEMSRFTNLYAASIDQAGMKGREDEQLEVLESINDLLGKNLTKVSEDQYETALGLYSMFSSSDQSMSGSKAASITESLDDAIKSGDNAMDIALGKYSGKFSNLWEFEKQKEKGIGDSENLASILSYFDANFSKSLDTPEGKEGFKQFLAANGADLDTATIEKIIENKDKIKSGEYADVFKDSVENQKGTESIDEQYSSTYGSSKLEDMNTYEAESLNAQERIGDSVNSVTSKLDAIYNDLPQWLQNTVSGGGALVGGAAKLGGGLLITKAGESIFKKIVGGGAAKGAAKTAGKAATTAAEAAAESTAAESGGGLLSQIGSSLSTATNSLYTLAGNKIISAGANGTMALASNIAPFAPALPDVIHGYKGFFSDIGDSISYHTDDAYKEYTDWKNGSHQSADDAFSDMKKAIENGTYKDWVEDYVSNSYKVDPKTGNTNYFDQLTTDLSQVIAGDTKGGTSQFELKTADAAKDWYNNIDETTLKSLLGISSISDAQASLQKNTEEIAKKKAKAGNYYNGYVDEKSSPFYGHETTFGYEGGGDYTDKDLETLKNTMIKDYVEKGSINVEDYFGGYTYQGGKYASYVNKVLRDMFGEDTGVKSNFVSELFKGQYDTGNSLDEGIESILKNYKDEYGDIVSSANEANTTALEENTKALQNLNSGGLFGLSNSSTSTTPIYGSNSRKSGSSSSSGTSVSSATSGLTAGFSSSLWGWQYKVNGSHATGYDYVPYDGYISELHKGEKVLDKTEADKYRSSSHMGDGNGTMTLEIKLSGSVDGITSESERQIVNAAVSQIKTYLGNSNMMNSLANNTVRVAN